MGLEHVQENTVFQKGYGENTTVIIFDFLTILILGADTIWIFMVRYPFVCVKTEIIPSGKVASFCLSVFYWIAGTSGDTLSPTKGLSSPLSSTLSHPETMKYQMIAASNKRFPLALEHITVLIPSHPGEAGPLEFLV